jgi:hypothetical protein
MINTSQQDPEFRFIPNDISNKNSASKREFIPRYASTSKNNTKNTSDKK